MVNCEYTTIKLIQLKFSGTSNSFQIFERINQLNLLSYISEPGYYEDGSFGVRVENVMEVKKVNLKVIKLV